jgi:hypothetical protein
MSTRCALCFVAGAAVAAALAVTSQYAWTRQLEVAARSTVHAPLLSMLAELQLAAQREDGAQLGCRIARLEARWRAYAFGGGEPPERFVPRLQAQGAAGCAGN